MTLHLKWLLKNSCFSISNTSWHVVFKDVETLSAILLLYWGASTFLPLHLLYFALPSSLDGNSIHGSVNVLITFNYDGKKKTIQFHSQICVNYFWIQIFWLRTAATLTLPVSDIYFTQDRVSILTLNFKSTRPVRRRLWMASRAEPTHESPPGILKQSLKMNEGVHP